MIHDPQVNLQNIIASVNILMRCRVAEVLSESSSKGKNNPQFPQDVHPEAQIF